jgi:hypothetical protein
VAHASSGPDEGIGAVMARGDFLGKNKAKPAGKVKTSFGFYRAFTGCFFVPILAKSTGSGVFISSLFVGGAGSIDACVFRDKFREAPSDFGDRQKSLRHPTIPHFLSSL